MLLVGGSAEPPSISGEPARPGQVSASVTCLGAPGDQVGAPPTSGCRSRFMNSLHVCCLSAYYTAGSVGQIRRTHARRRKERASPATSPAGGSPHSLGVFPARAGLEQPAVERLLAPHPRLCWE